MGYESNFEVPDIEDNLLRGVADLTDLLVCPDSEPEGGERGTSSRLLRLKEIASPGKRNVHARARAVADATTKTRFQKRRHRVIFRVGPRPDASRRTTWSKEAATTRERKERTRFEGPFFPRRRMLSPNKQIIFLSPPARLMTIL